MRYVLNGKWTRFCLKKASIHTATKNLVFCDCNLPIHCSVLPNPVREKILYWFSVRECALCSSPHYALIYYCSTIPVFCAVVNKIKIHLKIENVGKKRRIAILPEYSFTCQTNLVRS